MAQAFPFAAMAAFAVRAIVRQIARARTLIDRWAARAGVKKVLADRCWLWRYPCW